MPENVLQVLEDIYIRTIDNPTSVISSQGLKQELMIPIAAILLEYPVAYVPTSSDQTAFLSREPLDIYECRLVHTETEVPNQHTFLKFSCPSTIGVKHMELSPQKLTERMKERFIPRLQKVGDSITVDIHVSTEKFDRVAL